MGARKPSRDTALDNSHLRNNVKCELVTVLVDVQILDGEAGVSYDTTFNWKK